MGLLKGAGLAGGLVAAGAVLLARQRLSRVVDSQRDAEVTLSPVEQSDRRVAEPERGSALARVRLIVGGLGVLVLLYGIWKVLHAVLPASLPWLAVWLLGAVILHDGVLVPVVNLIRAGSQRGLSPLSSVARAWLRGGFLVAGVFVLVVVPAIYAKHLGPLNPTVLPGDYSRRLVVVLVAIGVLTVLGAAIASRRRARTP